MGVFVVASTNQRVIWQTSRGCIALIAFGGVWWGLALTTPVFAPLRPWPGVAVVLAAAMLLSATFRLRRKASDQGGVDLSESQRADATRVARGYGLTVAVEIVLVGAVWLVASGPALALPLTGLIVSVHFLPLAKVFSANVYYATAVAGTVVSVLAIADAFGRPITILSAGMGMVLWLTAIYLLVTTELGVLRNEASSTPTA